MGKFSILSVTSFLKEDLDLSQDSRRTSKFDIHGTAIGIDELESETGLPPH